MATAAAVVPTKAERHGRSERRLLRVVLAAPVATFDRSSSTFCRSFRRQRLSRREPLLRQRLPRRSFFRGVFRFGRRWRFGLRCAARLRSLPARAAASMSATLIFERSTLAAGAAAGFGAAGLAGALRLLKRLAGAGFAAPPPRSAARMSAVEGLPAAAFGGGFGAGFPGR